MNPPFGTRRKGVDVVFLEKAIELTRPGGVVYSLHKTCTRNYLQKKIQQWKCEGEVSGLHFKAVYVMTVQVGIGKVSI
jgi:predicted RNA methylase